MYYPDHISESLKTIFWFKLLKFFDADTEYAVCERNYSIPYLRRAVPPPGTMPSSTAALVALFHNTYLRRAVPPPGTMPSSTAALVAFKASVTRSFFSFTSTSLDPPI
jgi:hypothetical protein